MRILLLGVAGIALSGCSWLSGGYSYNQGGYYSHDHTGGHAGHAAPHAPKPLSKWSINGSIGTDFIVGGDAITGDDTPGAVNVHQVGMQEMYKPGYRGEAGLSYALNEKQSVTINGHYQEAQGKDNVIFANGLGGTASMTMSDYKAYGFEAGLRHNISPTRLPLLRSVQPYLEGRVGFTKTNDLIGENVMIGGGAAPDIALYEGRVVPTASALFGVEKPLSRHFSVGMETGLRYNAKSSSDDTDTGGTIFAEMNNDSSRWSVPVQIRGRYRF